MVKSKRLFPLVGKASFRIGLSKAGVGGRLGSLLPARTALDPSANPVNLFGRLEQRAKHLSANRNQEMIRVRLALADPARGQGSGIE
jgi:hypothetical protein